MPYSLDEIVQILSIRASTESIEMQDDALAALGEVGGKTSLRFAVQLLTPAKVLAHTMGRDVITAQDVNEIHALFYDAKQSAKILTEQEDYFLS